MIEISKAALSEIQRMQKVRDRVDGKFRIGIEAGGCRDLYYTINLELDESSDTGDLIYEVDGVSVLINFNQSTYLDQLKLDYAEDLMGGGFRFQNPQAVSVCECGNSFSLAEPIGSTASSPATKRWQLPA